MPIQVTPGVYVEETSGRAPSIDLAPTSTTAILGTTPDGPADTGVDVTGLGAYDAAFPGATGSMLRVAVEDFFANGGTRAVVFRVTDSEESLRELGKADVQLVVIEEGAITREKAYAACEEMGAFLLTEPENGTGPDPPALMPAGLMPAGLGRNTAVYYPAILDTEGVPRSCVAAVAGVFARTDAERGVWAAPAGPRADLVGASALAHELSEVEMRDLTLAHVNVLRVPPGSTSVVVWGARTAATEDFESRYVPVRRLVLHVERSLNRGLVWVPFESNDEALWAAVRATVTEFLDGLYRAGAFPAQKASEAYYVRCDRTTMTSYDIESGRLVVQVGIAPSRPGEFVLLSLTCQLQTPG